MTKQEQEKLVELIADGKNTYKDICENIPTITWLELRNMIYEPTCSIDCLVHSAASIPMNFDSMRFSDTDEFVLTAHGKDLLYQVQKERLFEKSQITAIQWAMVATRWAMFATCAGIAASVVSIIGIMIVLYVYE